MRLAGCRKSDGVRDPSRRGLGFEGKARASGIEGIGIGFGFGFGGRVGVSFGIGIG